MESYIDLMFPEDDESKSLSLEERKIKLKLLKQRAKIEQQISLNQLKEQEINLILKENSVCIENIRLLLEILNGSIDDTMYTLMGVVKPSSTVTEKEREIVMQRIIYNVRKLK